MAYLACSTAHNVNACLKPILVKRYMYALNRLLLKKYLLACVNETSWRFFFDFHVHDKRQLARPRVFKILEDELKKGRPNGLPTYGR